MKPSDPRQNEPRIEPRAHGQPSAEQLALARASGHDVLDLATTGRCAPASEVLLDAVRRAPLDAYPDPRAHAARTAIAAHLGTTAESILLGNGATELAWTCGRALARPETSAVVVMPGPGEFAAAARASGARVVQWRAVERTGNTVDLGQVRELIELERPGLVYTRAPAWPSGAPVAFESLQLLAAAYPGCTFVIDQTELELSEQHAELKLAPGANSVCLRSIGTSLGSPGLRVGYLWARPELCAYLEGRRPSFDTSCLAQRAAELWPELGEAVANRRSQLLDERGRLEMLLRDLGLTPTPSVTGGLLVRVTRAAEVAAELLREWGVAVCECAAYGLPDHLRISGVPEAAAPRLREALARVLERRRIPGGREI